MPNQGTRYSPPEKPHRLFKEDLLEEVLSAVEDGCFPSTAARASGIATTTWEEWLRWGRLGFEPYADLVDRLEQSEAKACVWHVRNMKKHAAGDGVVILKDAKGNETGVRTVGDWRPSTWWLARKFAKQWAEKEVLRQVAEEAIEDEKIELPIPLLKQYLAKLGFDVVPLNDSPGRSTQETKDATSKSKRGAKPRSKKRGDPH